LSIPDINKVLVPIGMPSKLAQMILFVSPTCPICKDLVPIAKDMAKADRVDLVFASDGGERDTHDVYIKRMKLEKYPYIVSLELGMKFEVGKLPYAVLIDSAGVLRSKGLVNSREHLESLVLAMESGYESIQDYLIKEERIGEHA
jgi:methylamine dehydrogenase accessory protein MauD